MPLRSQGLSVPFLAWNTTDNAGETGDDANFTLRLLRDETLLAPGGAINEPDAVNLPGLYWIRLTAAETDGNFLTLGGVSSTANVVITPVSIVTQTLLTPADIHTQVSRFFDIQTHGEPVAGQPPSITNLAEMVRQLYHTLVVDAMDYDLTSGYQNIYMADGTTVRYRKRVRRVGSTIIRDPSEAGG